MRNSAHKKAKNFSPNFALLGDRQPNAHFQANSREPAISMSSQAEPGNQSVRSARSVRISLVNNSSVLRTEQVRADAFERGYNRYQT
jgi:hypothetical protein